MAALCRARTDPSFRDIRPIARTVRRARGVRAAPPEAARCRLIPSDLQLFFGSRLQSVAFRSFLAPTSETRVAVPRFRSGRCSGKGVPAPICNDGYVKDNE